MGETLERGRARGGAVYLEEKQHQATSVALGLAGQCLEKSVGRQIGKEPEHFSQHRVLIGLLGELLELLPVECFPELAACDLGASGVDFLFRDETIGELE